MMLIDCRIINGPGMKEKSRGAGIISLRQTFMHRNEQLSSVSMKISSLLLYSSLRSCGLHKSVRIPPTGSCYIYDQNHSLEAAFPVSLVLHATLQSLKMIRSLVVLSVIVVFALSQTTTKSPSTTTKSPPTTTKKLVPPPACWYPYYTQSAFATGKTTCSSANVTTDCVGTAIECVTHPYTKKNVCCTPIATAVWPICPNKKKLLTRNKNVPSGMQCEPTKAGKAVGAICPGGYACVRATNDFTRIASTTANVCCSIV